SEYPQAFGRAYLERMAAKFGLPPGGETASLHPQGAGRGCRDTEVSTTMLIMDALQLLAQNHVDYTIFLRRLGDFDSRPETANTLLRDLFLDRAAFDAWAARYTAALRQLNSIDAERGASMRAVNPKYILRNHLAEIAIRRAADERDYSEVNRLHALLTRPFDEQPQYEAYAAEPPDWARKIEVSCSS
ncbi:MAG: protein adenylyltransferase SelO family protein, partial [Thiobacillus sp.]|nr:protein adenylyltransferase SelO family protein [Thiobacillus sp.]